MAELIFPTGFEEKATIAQDDVILMADSEDNYKIKKAKYSFLKGEKGDTGDKGDKGDTGDTGPQGEQGIQGEKGDPGQNGQDGADGQDGQDGTDGASIVSGEFVGDDLVFTKDDGNTVTIENAATTLQGPQGEEGEEGPQGPAGQDGADGTDGVDGNGIASITSSKSGKVTTVTITETNGNSESFQISDGQDGQGSGDVVGPNSATDGHLAVFDGITGKLIKDGGAVPSYSASDFDIKDLADSTSLRSSWSAKADTTIIDNTAYANTWDGDTTHAPTKNAVYDKFETLGTASTKNTGTSSGNVPVLDSNGKLNKSTLPGVALTDTFTVSTSSDLTGLSSAEQGDLAIATSENKTYVLASEPYSTAANWKEILAPTGGVTSVNTQTGAVTLDADDISDSTTTNKFVTSTEKSTWNGKQNALATQTAYTSKGTSTKVATITTNTLGQVTAISETSIDFPVTSVNGSTGAVTVDEFSPTSAGTVGQVLTKTAGGYDWSNAAGSDYSWVTKTISGGEIEIGLRTLVNVPTSNFTLTAPSTIKDGEEYVIRIISETSYTMTLDSEFTNPRNVDLTLSANATDQYVFLAINGELELQPLVATGS